MKAASGYRRRVIIIALVLCGFLSAALLFLLIPLTCDTKLSPADAQSVDAYRGAPPAITRVPVSAEPTLTQLPAPVPHVLSDLVPWLQQNPDLVGWLRIDGTVIDYPVLYKSNDEQYYLSHNFERNEDINGALFIQPKCDPFTPGTNIIIYGHNMKSGKMFGSLDAYKSKSYWEEHPIIQYNTLYEQDQYEIIAVVLSKVYNTDDDVFKYYQFYQANTEAEFDTFIDNIKTLSLYDTDIESKFGDTFITLSTCSYHTENGRLAVIARKIN